MAAPGRPRLRSYAPYTGLLIVVDATPLRYVAYYEQPDLSGVARAHDIEDRFTSDRFGNYANRNALIEEMHRWQLLGQFSTDPNTDMSWGCGGLIYYWIREADLAARRFDRVYGQLQSS